LDADEQEVAQQRTADHIKKLVVPNPYLSPIRYCNCTELLTKNMVINVYENAHTQQSGLKSWP